MGSLARFNIQQACEQFACRTFFETGTGSGASLAAASQAPFLHMFSVEIMPAIAAAARRRFGGDPRIQIVEAPSTTALRRILPQLPAEEPVLFWLDAHFPGADYGLAAYDAEPNRELRLPLEQELSILKDLRPASADVVIVDDLRIYLDGPFGNGNIPPIAQTLPPEARNIDFVRRLYGATHDCRAIFQDEGYLVLTPRPAAA